MNLYMHVRVSHVPCLSPMFGLWALTKRHVGSRNEIKSGTGDSLITRTYRTRRSVIVATIAAAVYMYLNRNMLARRYSHSLCRFGSRSFSTSIRRETKHYQFVVAGGGTGGLSIASTLCRKFPKSSALIEPSEVNWLNRIFVVEI